MKVRYVAGKRVHYFIFIFALLALLAYIAGLLLFINADVITCAYYLLYTRLLAPLVTVITLVLLYMVRGKVRE